LKSNRKKTPEELGEENGVIGAVDDAEEDHQVVSYSLTSYKTYEFMYYTKPFIIRIHIFYEFHVSLTPYTK
jgi:hypothetical protein